MHRWLSDKHLHLRLDPALVHVRFDVERNVEVVVARAPGFKLRVNNQPSLDRISIDTCRAEKSVICEDDWVPLDLGLVAPAHWAHE